MNTELFSGKAKVYHNVRPKYAAEMMDFLKHNEGLCGKTVADVGAGTGIFSCQLAEIGNKVFAVEPNDDMRLIMEQGQNADITVINGSAENTGLEDGSVDAVCAAQAFHWFDHKAFGRECRRILRPEGKVYLTWNNGNRADADFERLLAGCKTSASNDVSDVEKNINEFYEQYQVYKFANPIVRNQEMFLQSVLSRSYAPKPDDENYEDFVRKINEYFEQHNQQGYITSDNVSVLYVGYPRK